MSQTMRGVAYVSRAAYDYHRQFSELANSIEQIRIMSARSNARLGIGGSLYYYRGTFFQYLEGPSAKIESVMQKIKQDSRHTDFKLLLDGPVAKQRVANWGLKYVSLGGQIKEHFALNEVMTDLYELSSEQVTRLIHEIFDQDLAESGPSALNEELELMGLAGNSNTRSVNFNYVMLGLVLFLITATAAMLYM